MPFGIVTQTKAGFIKADIPEMEYETEWIPVINLFSGTNNSQFNIPLNTQVFIMNEYDGTGEIASQICIGTTNNDVDSAPFEKTKDGFLWNDGTEISYDSLTKTINIKSATTLNLEGVFLNLGTTPGQAETSLTTLHAFLTLVNTQLGKIPTPPTGPETTALNAALALVKVGVPSIQIPLI